MNSLAFNASTSSTFTLDLTNVLFKVVFFLEVGFLYLYPTVILVDTTYFIIEHGLAGFLKWNALSSSLFFLFLACAFISLGVKNTLIDLFFRSSTVRPRLG